MSIFVRFHFFLKVDITDAPKSPLPPIINPLLLDFPIDNIFF